MQDIEDEDKEDPEEVVLKPIETRVTGPAQETPKASDVIKKGRGKGKKKKPADDGPPDDGDGPDNGNGPEENGIEQNVDEPLGPENEKIPI